MILEEIKKEYARIRLKKGPEFFYELLGIIPDKHKLQPFSLHLSDQQLEKLLADLKEIK